jgi:hypothetical protein
MSTIHPTYAIESAKSYRAEQIKAAENHRLAREATPKRVWSWNRYAITWHAHQTRSATTHTS